MKKIDFNKILLYIALLIPFFEPAYINVKISILDKIYQILLIFSCLIITCISLKRARISKFTLITMIFEVVLIFICAINGNLEKNVIISGIKIISITLLINVGIIDSCRQMLKAMIILFEILILINFITLIVFPKGMYVNEVSGMTDNWFLGMDNIHVLYFLPLIILIYIYYKIYNKITIVNILSIIICILSVAIRWSATTVVGITLICGYMFFEKMIGKIKILNMYSYVISYIIMYFGIIIFQIQEKFSFLIEHLLKKDITFTKRTEIWNNTIKLIKEKTVIGYGIEDSKIRIQKISVTHAHNIFLEITYQGGIVLLGIFLYIIYEVLRKLQNNYDSCISKVLMFTIFTFFIMMISEAYNLFNIIFILSICDCINYFIKEKDEWSSKCREQKEVSLI